MGKKTIVISGINLYNGGPLSVYKDCLRALMSICHDKQHHVIAFVHKKELFKEFGDVFTFIELPNSRKSYAFRLYYEYLYFRNYSRKQHVDVWLSLHDITPNVKAEKRYVYCHNPTPFLKRTPMIWRISKKNYLMSLFYKYIYQINIKKNTNVIVQQDWIRTEFEKMFHINNIIVARPDIHIEIPQMKGSSYGHNRKKVFIYSAYPRPFKNFEIICEAAKRLESKRTDFEVWITINGTENPYSKMLLDKYRDLKTIRWMGIISRDEMMQKYSESDFLIFPSRLETWGLPITEYEAFDKPIICADLPYAHETVGTYHDVVFFDMDAPNQLESIMERAINGESGVFSSVHAKPVKDPCYYSWQELLQYIL